MTEDLIISMLAEWGPWAVVSAILWRCVNRQSVREDRLSEVIAANAVALELLLDRLERK